MATKGKVKVDTGRRTIDALLKQFLSGVRPKVELKISSDNLRLGTNGWLTYGYMGIFYFAGISSKRHVMITSSTLTYSSEIAKYVASVNHDGKPRIWSFFIRPMQPERVETIGGFKEISDNIFNRIERDLYQSATRCEVVAKWCEVLASLDLSEHIGLPPSTGN